MRAILSSHAPGFPRYADTRRITNAPSPHPRPRPCYKPARARPERLPNHHHAGAIDLKLWHTSTGRSFGAALITAASGAAAQDSPGSSRPVVALGAALVEGAPTIDGLLDDTTWQDAPVIDAFTQVNPIAGAPPTERTEVRLLYDADTLYLGVRCFDAQPGKIEARSMARDADHGSDDRITFSLDTFADRRNGYVFVVSAAGGKRDGLIESTRTRWEWDGLWTAKTSVDELGWTAEVAIPMKTLSFDPTSTAWGFNIERFIRHKNESVRWATPTRDSGVTSMNDSGEIDNLAGLVQGLGLTVKPFLTAKADLDSGDLKFEPGVDLFYKITPSTTAALTINTDFAEAEVDQRRVNLTRFPLFFPEKRAFFLEDSGIFEFGGINQSPKPFFSRRIGIVGGEEKDILAGLRVTGRTGGMRFGVLDVQMKDDDKLGRKNLGVLRLKHDVGDESSVGMILTNGAPGRRGNNQLVGLDYNYVNSDALGGRVSADAWAMATHDDPEGAPGRNDSPYAFGGRFNWNADPWSFFLFAAEVGEDFRPGLGFVQRPGTREFASRGGYTWRPEDGGWIRSINTTVGASAYTTLGSEVQTAEFDLPRVTLETESGDSLFAVALLDRERLDDPFEIVDGVTIPTGEYDNAGWRTGFTTSAARPVTVEANYSERGFYDGTRKDTFVNATFRPTAALSLSGEYFLNEIELAEGDFTVRTARARATLQFSPELSWDNTLQWDNQSDQAGLNSRVRYEFRPGQEVFVVYNEGFDVEESEFESIDRGMTVKLGLTFRF